MIRVALLGYGAVAAIHAQALRAGGASLEVVVGPDLEKARQFAAEHGFNLAVNDEDTALDVCEAVVVASPNEFHFAQALQALERRRHVLVELPPCSTPAEAARLAAAAECSILLCAHTSRFLAPYRMLGDAVRSGALGGEIRQISYFRNVRLAARSWNDDALMHHAAHAVDLALHWTGSVQPVACIASPVAGPIRDVSVLGLLPSGGPLTIGVSYGGQRPGGCMTVVGSERTVRTDGFSFLEGDDPSRMWRGDERASYLEAVGAQDGAFLKSCETGVSAIPWEQTARMCAFLSEARRLSGEVNASRSRKSLSPDAES